MSICLTWFHINGLGKPKLYQNMWCFTRMWEDCGGCLTCEELVGFSHRGWLGWNYEDCYKG